MMSSSRLVSKKTLGPDANVHDKYFSGSPTVGCLAFSLWSDNPDTGPANASVIPFVLTLYYRSGEPSEAMDS